MKVARKKWWSNIAQNLAAATLAIGETFRHIKGLREGPKVFYEMSMNRASKVLLSVALILGVTIAAPAWSKELLIHGSYSSHKKLLGLRASP